mgnify:FL=1
MDSIVKFFEEKLAPVASRVSTQRHLMAIRDGLVLTMPLMIVGSIIIIFSTDFPVPGWAEFITGIFPTWDDFIWGVVFSSTMSISALVATMGITFSLVKSYGEEGIVAAGLAFAAFFLLQDGSSGAWSTGILGAEGLFLAIIVALIVSEIYVRVIKANMVIRLPESVPVAISRSFVALVPGAIIIVLFALIHVLFALTSYGTAQVFIINVLQIPLVTISASYLGAMFTSFFISIFWAFGLHGDLIVGSVVNPLIQAGYLANVDALRLGLEIPNIAVEGFQSLFINVGGTGATLGIAIVCAFFAKSKQLRLIGRLSLGPGIFNINEPIVFGLPIVLNPMLLIPYIIAPLVVGTLTYFAMALNLVNRIVAAPPWTTPVFIAGFIATGGDFRAVILQAINLVIVLAIYYPFLAAWDKKQYELENSSVKE